MRLLTLDPSGVQKLIDGLEKEVNDIKKSAIKLSWYMRGGASYTDIMNMSNFERKCVLELVEENLETTKKSGIAFF